MKKNFELVLTKKEKQRLAGIKAAETRRANALKTKRSEAAKKAAETRKTNALKAKRSAAAKKAWVTIRAKKEAANRK